MFFFLSFSPAESSFSEHLCHHLQSFTGLLPVIVTTRHLKSDRVSSGVVAPQIPLSLLCYELLRLFQPIDDLVDRLTGQLRNLIVRAPSELLLPWASQPYLLYIVQQPMEPNRQQHQVFPVVIVRVMVAMVNLSLSPFSLTFPIIRQKGETHQRLDRIRFLLTLWSTHTMIRAQVK